MRFEIKTMDPKASIEACSIIDYFKVKIINDRLGNSDDDFYSFFLLDGDDKSFAILSGIPNIKADIVWSPDI